MAAEGSGTLQDGVEIGPTMSSEIYEAAAAAIHDADYLLVLAGAGMSADSGLGTYEAMPSTYREFCDPAKLADASTRKDFEAFWKAFAVQYAETDPHEGYAILDRWCHGGKLERLSKKPKKRDRSESAGGVFATDATRASISDVKWWVYTSNVDGHFRRFPSFRCRRQNETRKIDGSNVEIEFFDNVCEIHGRAREFRCSSGIGYFGREGFPRMGDLWAIWNEGVERFRPPDSCKLYTKTLEELSERKQEASERNSSTSPTENCMPLCKDCGSLPLRPNVLLFNDTDENVLQPIQSHRYRYQEWETEVEARVCDPATSANLVLIELGCGKSVPAVRQESEEVLADTLDGLVLFGGSVKLLRINPKDSGIDDERLAPHVVSIPETSLKALREIDRALDAILVAEQRTR